jgi:hypothetical protein
MDNGFFERPILNSPYQHPARHWELDAQGQPTGEIIEARRTAQFITPIPKPKKYKASTSQAALVFDEGLVFLPPGSNMTPRRSSTSCGTVWTSGGQSAIRAIGA